MLTRPDPNPARHMIDVRLRADLIAEAQELGVDLSEACESGLADRVARAKAERWYQENREAVDYWNRYVDEHGLPLARYRQF